MNYQKPYIKSYALCVKYQNQTPSSFSYFSFFKKIAESQDKTF